MAIPWPIATHAVLPPVDDVLAKVPARELYERTGIQIIPINTMFELAALAADGDAGLTTPRRC